MDEIPCPHCGADLRKTGVREYGFVAFDIHLVWDDPSETFAIADDDEPRYGDCSSLDWACPTCQYELDDHPDFLVD